LLGVDVVARDGERAVGPADHARGGGAVAPVDGGTEVGARTGRVGVGERRHHHVAGAAPLGGADRQGRGAQAGVGHADRGGGAGAGPAVVADRHAEGQAVGLLGVGVRAADGEHAVGAGDRGGGGAAAVAPDDGGGEVGGGGPGVGVREDGHG